jgi:hypothetical protein
VSTTSLMSLSMIMWTTRANRSEMQFLPVARRGVIPTTIVIMS